MNRTVDKTWGRKVADKEGENWNLLQESLFQASSQIADKIGDPEDDAFMEIVFLHWKRFLERFAQDHPIPKFHSWVKTNGWPHARIIWSFLYLSLGFLNFPICISEFEGLIKSLVLPGVYMESRYFAHRFTSETEDIAKWMQIPIRKASVESHLLRLIQVFHLPIETFRPAMEFFLKLDRGAIPKYNTNTDVDFERVLVGCIAVAIDLPNILSMIIQSSEKLEIPISLIYNQGYLLRSATKIDPLFSKLHSNHFKIPNGSTSPRLMSQIMHQILAAGCNMSITTLSHLIRDLKRNVEEQMSTSPFPTKKRCHQTRNEKLIAKSQVEVEPSAKPPKKCKLKTRCVICNNGNQLVVCSKCKHPYHLYCCGEDGDINIKGLWSCVYCLEELDTVQVEDLRRLSRGLIKYGRNYKYLGLYTGFTPRQVAEILLKLEFQAPRNNPTNFNEAKSLAEYISELVDITLEDYELRLKLEEIDEAIVQRTNPQIREFLIDRVSKPGDNLRVHVIANQVENEIPVLAQEVEMDKGEKTEKEQDSNQAYDQNSNQVFDQDSDSQGTELQET
eukprot:TRINITY_DN7885_c0_g1_i2.p1 TRINITY_DN7885_c0_g1~~TRINITY_DN7885_c0_g1_i2.p1  ORF type:complete len:560 (-),score=146.52 TRINITY_DN7885_c0_g1_i2:62-1741(-)